MSIVDKLDIRRMQVLVEAIIVDINVNKNAELGVNWAVWSDDDDTRIPVGTFQQPVGGVNLTSLAQSIDNPSGGNPLLGTGTTFGIGRIAATGVNFAAMLRAIQGDSNTNIIATPVRRHDGQPGSRAQGGAGSARSSPVRTPTPATAAPTAT